MLDITNYPILLFALSLILLWLSAKSGAYLRRKLLSQEASTREDLDLILTASLTLLGLIIGFSFSMAISRYDQRKNYEEEEANAIGTEYLRADVLPPADTARTRALLKSYLDQRVLFYVTRSARRLKQISATTAQLQTALWVAVWVPASAQPTPLAALAVSGMNDVLNSQGYTQAAWWNSIPGPAWVLMGAIAICCNFLFGYNSRRTDRKVSLLVILPLIVAISFFLIADMDSPRGGVIRVHPRNLISLSRSLR